ncbi:MAG: diguanylate cyclase [Lachnospiraceae bacterium]|nr:diguanylate cyclase [Lachnospiraceae bacterium]
MEGKKGFNKSQLQLIAVAAMLIDHLAWAFVDFWTVPGQIMHVAGRLTIPIMCFFIAEGYRKTRNLYRYINRIACFAVISVVPFYIFFSEEYGFRQNIIFDHLLSILILTVLEHGSLKKWMKVVLTVILFGVSAVIGGWPFTPELFTLAFYYGKTFKDKAKWFVAANLLTVVVVSILAGINQRLHFAPYDWAWYDRGYLLGFMLALPVLARYDGGKGKSPFGRYFFYVFYPVHMLLLALLKYLMSGDISHHDIYLGLHVVCLLIVCIMLVMVFRAKASRMQAAIIMFLVMESFYIIGFIVEITATATETFYMAAAIEYFGELPLLVAFLLFTSECGHIKIPLFVYIAHVVLAFVLVFSIISSPRTHFFYSDIILTSFEGYTRAQYVHGTGYYISVGYIAVVIAEMFFIMINSLLKGTLIEKKRVAVLFAGCMFIWIPYAITLTGITGGYEVPVVGVVGVSICLTLCFYLYGTLDSVAIVSESALAKAGEGVVIIDDRDIVTFSNAVANDIIGAGELTDMNAAKNETIQNILRGKLTELRSEGRLYEVKVEEIKHRSYIQGHTIWILDATEHREMLNEAEHKANHDGLTGLYNRRYFESLVKEEIRNKVPGTLVMSDMDNFKAVNDTYGHKRGDYVLVSYAKILQAYPEEKLYPCRIGGDEFMFYLRGMSGRTEIEELIKQIMREFAKHFEDSEIKCTLSVGVAINGDPDRLAEFNTLYMEADGKLYAAKGNGKNTYVI